MGNASVSKGGECTDGLKLMVTCLCADGVSNKQPQDPLKDLHRSQRKLMTSADGLKLMEDTYQAFKLADEEAQNARFFSRAAGSANATFDTSGLAGGVCVIVGIALSCTGGGAVVGAPLAIAGFALGGASGAAGVILSLTDSGYRYYQNSTVDSFAEQMLKRNLEAIAEFGYLEQREADLDKRPHVPFITVYDGIANVKSTVTGIWSMINAGKAGVKVGAKDFEKALQALRVARNGAKAGGIAMAGIGMLVNVHGLVSGVRQTWSGRSKQADGFHQLADIYLKLMLKMKTWAGAWPELDCLKGLRLQNPRMLRLKVLHFKDIYTFTMCLPDEFYLKLTLPDGRSVRTKPRRWTKREDSVDSYVAPKDDSMVLEFSLPAKKGDMILEVNGERSLYNTYFAWTKIPHGKMKSDPGSSIAFELEEVAFR